MTVTAIQCPANLGHPRPKMAAICGRDQKTCAMTEDGRIGCWGMGTNGELGIGTTSQRTALDTEEVLPGHVATALACGDANMCAVTDDGSLYCWGQGLYGALGTGSTSNIGDTGKAVDAPPVNLGAGVRATGVTIGRTHVCTWTTDGDAFCFGHGFEGQLGNGVSGFYGDDSGETPAAAGAIDLGPLKVHEMAAGDQHTCMLDDNGDVYCWGYNGNGELGRGDTESIGNQEPVKGNLQKVDLGAGRTATQIVAADGCSGALLDDGTVRIWGQCSPSPTWEGDLGDDEQVSAAPVMPFRENRKVIELVMSSGNPPHMCVRFEGDTMTCWGGGDGSGRLARPTWIAWIDDPSEHPDIYVGGKVIGMGVTERSSCAIVSDEAFMVCWGGNGFGALGRPSTSTYNAATMPPISGPGSLVSLFVDKDSCEVCAPPLVQVDPKDDEEVAMCEPCPQGTFYSEELGECVDCPPEMTTTMSGDACMNCPLGWYGLYCDKECDEGSYRNASSICEECAPGSVSDGIGLVSCTECDTGEAPNRQNTVCEACDGDLVVSTDASSCVCNDDTKGRDRLEVLDACAGQFSSAVILTGGIVRVFGSDSNRLVFGKGDSSNLNEIGVDDFPSDHAPVDLGGAVATSISCGQHNIAVTTDDGKLFVWGLKNNNVLGFEVDYNIGKEQTPGEAGPLGLGDGNDAIKVCVGTNHACAIVTGNRVKCWGGSIGSGILGLGITSIPSGTSTASVDYVDIGSGVEAADISCGKSSTCVVTTAGNVLCWGSSTYGKLGQVPEGTSSIGATTNPSDFPFIDFGDGVTISQVSAGEFHTCAVSTDGKLYCFGRGFYGALGRSRKENVGDGGISVKEAGPIDLGDGVTASSVSVSTTHTCTVTSIGVLCFGRNYNGQLGTPGSDDTSHATNPRRFDPVYLGPSSVSCTKVVLGASLTNLAILDDGTIIGWGLNSGGGLGTGIESITNIGDDETPAFIGPVNVGLLNTCSQCRLGYAPLGVNHECVLCPGASTASPGDNSCTKCDIDEAAVDGVCTPCGDGQVPHEEGKFCVPCEVGYFEEVPGNCTACAPGFVSESGATSCNVCNATTLEYAELDSCEECNGDLMASSDHSTCVCPSPLGRQEPIILDMCVADKHICAVREDYKVFCWGDSTNGRTGYGTTRAISNTPAEQGWVDLGKNFLAVEVSCFYSNTCARSKSGEVMCWGNWHDGMLGMPESVIGARNEIGNNEDPSWYGTLDIGANVTKLSVGRSIVCTLLANSSVLCWGKNAFGGLGLGHTEEFGTDRSPVEGAVVYLGEEAVVTDICAGALHACAVVSPGDVYCWGRGNNGVLGYGNEEDIGDDELPFTVGPVDLGNETAISVSCGDSTTCALLEGGNVTCWGGNSVGTLGLGHLDPVSEESTPAEIGTIDLGDGVRAVAVSASQSVSCVITETADAMCWGQSTLGSLGYGEDVSRVGDDEVPGDMGAIPLGFNVSQISSYSDVICATRVEGGMRCWGNGHTKRIGWGETYRVGTDERPVANAGFLEMGISAGTSCVPCEPGFIPSGEYEACIRCEGASVSESGNVTCTPCQFGEAAIDNVCTPCASGEAISANGKSCFECPAGTFVNGTMECEKCAPGSVAPAGSDSCTICDGSGEVAILDDICSTCTGDLVPDTTRENCVCGVAGEGYVGDADTCAPCAENFFPDSVTTECIACPAGLASDPGDSTCSKCSVLASPRSFWSDVDLDCILCSYRSDPLDSGTGCVSDGILCAQGTIADSNGDCVSCTKVDEYGDFSTQSCKSCPAGQIPNSNDDGCVDCPGGAYESPRGQCKGKCNEYSNSYSPPGSGTCSRCTFMLTASPGRISCISPCESVDCGPNGICYLDSDDAASCACGIGLAPSTDPVTCVTAPAKKASCENGKVDGHETDVDCGGGACNPCPVGFYCDSTASCQDGSVCERDDSSPMGGTCAPDLIKRGLPVFAGRIELKGLGTAQVRLAAARLIAEAFRRGLTDLTEAVVDAVDMDQVVDDVANGRRLSASGSPPPSRAFVNLTLTFNASTTTAENASAAVSDFLHDAHNNDTSPLALEARSIAEELFMDPNGIIIIGTSNAIIELLEERTTDSSSDTIEYEELECDGNDEYKADTGCRTCGDGEVANDKNDGCIECARGEEKEGVCRDILAFPNVLEAGIIAVIVLVFLCTIGVIYALCHRHRRSVRERRERISAKMKKKEAHEVNKSHMEAI